MNDLSLGLNTPISHKIITTCPIGGLIIANIVLTHQSIDSLKVFSGIWDQVVSSNWFMSCMLQGTVAGVMLHGAVLAML